MKQVTLTAKVTVPNRVAEILEEWAADDNHGFDFVQTLVIDGHQHYTARAPFKVRVKDAEA